ncbi:MAG TPA: exodeoxyribonuclease V subunit alpha [Sedimenticola thiotaurini]|uniref:RecBCD enzyme subunit RecD n=1 Tax=Sedimenticola thiotaurini TaxID=1543721 RepID=A0A831RK16_9GAMM|nr:exodeoxyribonuclease V subunit alpha [Sedimenticola thiotaurini]
MGLAPQDLQFADLMGRLATDAGPELLAAAALCSRATGEGHLCLDLEAFAGREIAGVALPGIGGWRERLRGSGVVGEPGSFHPLILDPAGRLYLYRYWAYESHLAEELVWRAGQPPEDIGPEHRSLLQQLFPAREGVKVDWQKLAAATALCRNLTVVSGGPGTGKTSTVVRILALLTARAPELRIALAAPTGKAAGRLEASVRMAREALPLDREQRQRIPGEASTLHRLLGAEWGGGGYRYHGGSQLPLDVLILDEASMVDVAMMAHLVEALPRRARLILLGDRFQLASVEAGAVLGDLCGDADGFSHPFRERLRAVTGEKVPASPRPHPPPLADSVVYLRHSYRFSEASGVGRLAQAVRDGDAAASLTLLNAQDGPELGRLDDDRLLSGAVAGFRDYLSLVRGGEDPLRVFAAFDRFRVLAAMRRGRRGVEGLNHRLEQALLEAGLLQSREGWYQGRPVMVLQNDYGLRLYNGDIGIVLGGDGPGARVCFPDGEAGLRWIPPSRLPPHETAFVMTVHKSQGSEFDRVLLVLPQEDRPLLTRELIYTAVTRARERFQVCAPDAVWAAAVERRTRRSSGLREALWGPPVSA